jgi:hypothetical protein
MRSQWISHKDHQIFWQDFSHHGLLDIEAVKEELMLVEEIVIQQPENSLLVLADFRNTQIGKDLMDAMIASSSTTKSHIKKTAVLGVFGTKRILADALVRFTGQQLTFFDDIEKAKDWLVE